MGIGDEIMAAGHARVMHEQFPRRKVIIRDRHGGHRWHPIWEGNPHIVGQREVAKDAQTLFHCPGHRPYHKGKTDAKWIYNLDYRAPLGQIFLTPEEKKFGARYAGKIIIEPHIKQKASPNKQWGWVRWNKLIYIADNEGYKFAQLGPVGTQELQGMDHIETPTFRQACAVLAGACAYVGHEGGLHHAAAALGIPSVVIFGGFTPIELTGYEGHRNIGASLGEACGNRQPCPHCAKWMESITPDFVLKQLKELLHG